MDLKPCAEYNGSDFGARASVTCRSDDMHVNFCIHGTKIYSIDSRNLCRSVFKVPKVGDMNTLVNYLELTDGTLNAVRTDGKSAVTNFSTAINDIGNYVLVNCYKGECKQTQGYLKTTDDHYYTFIGTVAGKVADPVGSASGAGTCSGNVGKLFSDKKICVSESNSIGFTELNPYMIGYSAVNTPFTDMNYGFKLMINANYIIKDMFYSGGMNLKVSN